MKKYAIHFTRTIDTNVIDRLYCHTYDNISDYLNALNAIMDALKLAGAFVCAHDEEDNDFVVTYVHIK